MNAFSFVNGSGVTVFVMSYARFVAFVLVIAWLLSGCQRVEKTTISPLASEDGKSFVTDNPTDIDAIRIAFLADIHFHDVYGNLETHPHYGIPTKTPAGTQHALIRSMRAQLHSTRLFNENYFVLLSALDDLARRKVKWVALPGDFSDDGQPVNVKGLVEILNYYETNFGMRFFAIPGNHDPVKPFTIVSGKSDFLDKSGREVAIYGHNAPQCDNGSHDTLTCSDAFNKWGYAEIMRAMQAFGFMPRDTDVYYETPFEAANNSKFDQSLRHFSLCPRSSDSIDSPKDCVAMPDASYLAEPVDGLWLLGIDANVYLPKDDSKITTNGGDYIGSSSAGYNALLKHKPFLMAWIRSVVTRAKQRNKTLVAFSHFPMTDFYDNAQDEMERLFGKGKQQMVRLPLLSTAEALADTGLQLHVGGHMHINDTGSVTGQTGNTLFNIQAPTLAAYRPAYKLLTFDNSKVEVDTVIVEEVSRFNELFAHYRTEHSFLTDTNAHSQWDDHILHAANYGEFTDLHLQELVKQRYLKKDWPEALSQPILNTSVGTWLKQSRVMCPTLDSVSDDLDLAAHKGIEIIFDFYRLRNADSIALVSDQRKAFYKAVFEALTRCDIAPDSREEKYRLLFSIMNKFIDSQPSEHLVIDLETGELLPQ